jgi:transcriptional regulator with XRE-family HTH domain
VDGAVLREWRRSRGWDVPELARRLRVTAGHSALPEPGSLKRMIWRWEREGLSTERYVLLYAKTLGISTEALVIGPVEPGVSSLMPVAGSEDGDDPVKRREFGMAALGALAGTLVPPGKVPASVSMAHVTGLRQAAASLWTRDRNVGGTALLSEANGIYTAARAMLDRSSYTSAVGGGLQAVTAELAACTGFAAFDAADQATARAMLIEAALLAGDDPLLAARGYSLLAMQSAALAVVTGNVGRARESLRFTGRAAEAAKHEPSPRLHAAISMRRATASALLGDEAMIRASITAARRELDRGDHPGDPAWTGYVTWSEITAHEAVAMQRSGRPHHAARLFREVLADQALPPRNRALYKAQLAASLAASSDQAEAVAEGLRVLPMLEGPVRSARAVNELRPVRQAVTQDSEFAVRFDALASASWH